MAVALTARGFSAGQNSSGGVTTYTGINVGTVTNDRIIILMIGKEVASVVVNSVTVDYGLGAIPMLLANGVTFGSMGSWIYYLFAPTGNATGDISITWSGAVLVAENYIQTWSVVDAALPPLTGTDTSTDMDTGDPLTTGSSTIPTNGGMLAHAACAADTVAKTWANLTVNFDIDAGGFRFDSASSVTAGAATRTLTGGTNGEDGAMTWVIFSQQVVPELNKQTYR